MSEGGGRAAPAADRPRAATHEPRFEGGNPMDSWSETRSLVVLMTIIAVCYVLGRALAEML